MTIHTARHHITPSTLGFSMVELSVVLAIIAAMAGSLLVLGERQQEISKYDATAEKLRVIEDALERYVMVAGNLPCPAERDPLPNTGTFGTATDCSAAAPAGVTDVSTDGAITADDIRIGVLPVRELNLPDFYMYDAWNSRFTYVVVKDLAIDQATFDAYSKPATNGIEIRDSAAGTIIIGASTGNQLAAYLIVSHGDDKKGATPKSGGTASTCTAGHGDEENCNNDNIFVDKSVALSASTDAAFFDDLVLWKAKYLIDPSMQ